MGVWGVGIYSNDTAQDVKELCNDVYSFLSIEDANRVILEEFNEIASATVVDNDYVSFWYAWSDWLWTHGVLNEDIKKKALELLSTFDDTANWKEHSGQVDKKRKAVLLKLRKKLEMPQPSKRIPKQKLAKPKHKIGDIIVFRSVLSAAMIEYDLWSTDTATITVKSNTTDLPVRFDGYNKYFAVICVGTKKEPRLSCLPDAYDEHSIYAVYDYCDSNKPTIRELQQCGFLPGIWNDCCQETSSFANWSWTYHFYTCDNFKPSEPYGIESVEVISCLQESTRFHSLIAPKNCSGQSLFFTNLPSMVIDLWERKIGLRLIGEEIDTLLPTNKDNSTLKNTHKET